MSDRKISVAYRKPFDISGHCWVEEITPGHTVLEIVQRCPVLPDNFEQDGYVCINGEIVPRPFWAFVRPKPPRPDRYIAVTMHTTLHNGAGGGNAGKQIGALVGAIALTIITAGVASGTIGLALGIEALSTAGLATYAAAGAIGIAGSLALTALTAPPTAAAGVDAGQSVNSEQAEAAAASGNILDRGGAIPRVIGTRKIFPPLAQEPIVELIDQDEEVTALYILNGPHLLEDIRIDGTSIADAEDIEYETLEGWPDDPAQSIVTRQGKTIAPSLELSDDSVQGDGALLTSQALPETSLSVWHGVSSRSSPDEIWMHLLFPGGIYPGSNSFASVPLRVRLRKKGDAAWTNLPELLYQFNSTNQRRVAILFKWQTAEVAAAPPTSSQAGFWYADLTPPGSTNTPNTPADKMWTASSYFDNGTGTDHWWTGTTNNTATTKIRNMNMFDNRLEVYLDESTFPKGIYEIQIRKGTTLASSAFPTTGTYAYTGFGGASIDPFWYWSSTGFRIFVNHSNYSDRCVMTRLISIWNEIPITRTGELCTIALSAINRNVRQLSIKASGWVKDWDGSDWTVWTTTSNPAPHYRDVLSGSLNLDPLPDDLRDDDGLVDWRMTCFLNNWTCDSIVNDTRTQDVLSLLASCGYARPYQSDIYGITVDDDRSGDTPVQIFSRRNSANLSYAKAFARLPAGFNVTYRDEDLDDDQAQVTVYPTDPTASDLTLLEAVTYDGLVDVDKVSARALFDLDQASLRSVFYSMDVDIESIVCRRGSLVGVEHDVLTNRSGDGYIVSKQTSGSPAMITGITLDAEISVTNNVDMHSVTDMHAVTDMHTVGVVTGVVIRHTDGTLSTHQLSNVTGSTNVLTFATPILDDSTIQGFSDNNRKYGCLVVAGDMGSIYRRLLVQSISATKDLKASMTLVDEAPTLTRFAGPAMLLAMDDLTQLKDMSDGSTALEVMS